jgi:hypothetical protein
MLPAGRSFGYRLPWDEFTRLLGADPGVLIRAVLDHKVVHLGGLRTDLERIAREFGRPILYYGPRASACIIRVVESGVETGKPDGEARLRALKEHAVREEYLTEVRLTAGSFVIWDNLALLHAATTLRHSDRDGERRRVLRMSVH